METTKSNPPTKRQLRYFKIGMFVTKNCNSDLFNPPIKILSEQHAKAIYLTQSKGHRYT